MSRRLTAGAALAALALATVAATGPSAAGATTQTRSGVLEVLHEDHPDAGHSVHRYRLLGADGKRTELLFGDRGPETLGAHSVRVTGTQVRPGVLRVGSSSAVTDTGTATGSTGTATATATATQTKRVAVILYEFSDTTTRPATSTGEEVTPAIAATHLFGTGRSTSGFLTETSFGQLALTGAAAGSTTGDVFDWVRISAASTDSCDYNAWGSQARALAGSDGFVEASYDHVVHLMPKSTCGFAGLAYMPGTYSWTVLHPGREKSLEERLRQVTSHELGHNFGIHHAGTWSCKDRNGRPVTLSTSCTLTEYGDPFSVMGISHEERQYHGYQKGRLGWLSAGDDTQDVTATDTYSLASISSDVTGTPQVLRIARPKVKGQGGDFYYLELRQPTTGFDAFADGSAVTTGVSLRIAPGYGTNAISKLLDTTPGTATFDDAALKPGQSFTDSTGLKVTVNAVTNGVASVTVTLPATRK